MKKHILFFIILFTTTIFIDNAFTKQNTNKSSINQIAKELHLDKLSKTTKFYIFDATIFVVYFGLLLFVIKKMKISVKRDNFLAIGLVCFLSRFVYKGSLFISRFINSFYAFRIINILLVYILTISILLPKDKENYGKLFAATIVINIVLGFISTYLYLLLIK